MDTGPNTTLCRTATDSTSPIPRSAGGVLGAAAAVGAAALLTWLAAEVRIPVQPVPITLQTLVVLLSGALIGARRGSASQIVYLGMGLAGVPLFAGGASGFAVLSGPTGGYLVGFLAAPAIVGRWIGGRPDFFRALAAFSAAALAILILGVLHLALFYTHDLGTAVRVGLIPFVLGDAAKVFAATSIYCTYRRLQTGRFPV